MNKILFIFVLIFSNYLGANTVETNNWLKEFEKYNQNQYTKEDCIVALNKIRKSEFQRGHVDFKTTLEDIKKQYSTKEDCLEDLREARIKELKFKKFFAQPNKEQNTAFAYNREAEAAKLGLPVNYIPIPTRARLESRGALFEVKLKMGNVADTVISSINLITISLAFIVILLCMLYKKVSLLT